MGAVGTLGYLLIGCGPAAVIFATRIASRPFLVVLTFTSCASWILCAAVLKDDWPTHVESWLVFNLALAAAETLYGAWACVVDARDTTFFERSTRSFLIADGVFATMQLAVAVTGAAYWRGGGSSADEVFDCAVVLAWFALAALAVMAWQDKVKGDD